MAARRAGQASWNDAGGVPTIMLGRPTGTVTFLFTDVEGSTRLWEHYPDAMKHALASHDALMRSVMAAHGGAIFTTAGDEFCTAFSAARRAVDAAVAAQIGLQDLDWGELPPFRVRMALHTGAADERDGDYFGQPLNRCARLLSVGHGGQVLLSSATSELIRHELPDGVGLVDLGAHRLRDLDESEHVYQLVHPRLERVFPALRTAGEVQDAAAMLAEGRQAHAAERWRHAYNALSAARSTIDLEAEDLERLAVAAWWIGNVDESGALREQAYAGYRREGRVEAAAHLAIALAEQFHYQGKGAVSSAWTRRAERLLSHSVDSPAHAEFLRWSGVLALEVADDPQEALALGEKVVEAGRRLESRNLEALGLQDMARALVAMGRVREGMELVDEVMVTTVGGELDTFTTGRSYCNMLDVCDLVADYRRAGQWSEAAEEWCDEQPDATFPGICRIHRAELKRRHGDWVAAARDLEQAERELAGYAPLAGAARYQRAEIDLRTGDLDAAEKSYVAAHQHGFVPLPGAAELRLRRGDPAGARELLEGLLQARASTPVQRARLLPTHVDASIALGDLDVAATSLRELEDVAETCDSLAMRAAAAHRRAALALARGEAGEALLKAQAAVERWIELKMPYEAAQSRLLLAEAHEATGRRAAAAMERAAARATFESLGAQSDLAQLAGSATG